MFASVVEEDCEYKALLIGKLNELSKYVDENPQYSGIIDFAKYRIAFSTPANEIVNSFQQSDSLSYSAFRSFLTLNSMLE